VITPLASREYLETKCYHPSLDEQQHHRNWHAVFTLPQNEKSVVKHLEIREIESFLPTYALALAKNDPFVFVKSDPRQEHPSERVWRAPNEDED
jgi:hypothetical protein